MCCWRIPDETTILNFLRLLEKYDLAAGILGVINDCLGDRGLLLRHGTIVDATIKRTEHECQKMIWSIFARLSSYKKHGKKCPLGQAIRKIEYARSQVRAKVEHPLRVIKRQFSATPRCAFAAW